MINQLNLISYAFVAVALLFSCLAIVLSKKGKRVGALTSLSYICVIGFLIVGLYRINDLASKNNFTALIQDVSIRSKASVIIAVLVVIVNFIPFVTYKTPEDAKIAMEQKKNYAEIKKHEKEESERILAEKTKTGKIEGDQAKAVDPVAETPAAQKAAEDDNKEKNLNM